MREVSLSAVTEAILTPIVGLGALSLMGLFFLIAGLLTPGSLERKGTRRFVSDRLLRLGVPFAAVTLVLWPLLIYAIREPFLHRGSYWWWFAHADPLLDNGPVWFVGVLLIYTLGYAGWRAWRPADSRPPPGARPLPGRLLVGLGAVIAVSSFAVRLAFPVDSGQPLNLHLWEWPQCLGLFSLGVVAARRGWLMPVPDSLRRSCGVVAGLAVLALPVLIFTSEPLGLEEEVYYGGFGWPSLATCAVEGALAVAGSVWVLAAAQRHLSGGVRPWLARSAYAAFLVQGPVLIALAVALRRVPVAGDVKAILVAVAGVGGSYAVARPLVTSTPLRRII